MQDKVSYNAQVSIHFDLVVGHCEHLLCTILPVDLAQQDPCSECIFDSMQNMSMRQPKMRLCVVVQLVV